MNARDRVLQAALARFVEDGCERTTIARIRERSRVSNGALFHHFPTKDAIAGARYLDSIAAIQGGYRRSLAQHPMNPADAAAGVIRQQLSRICDHPDRARFLYSQVRLDWNTDIGNHSPTS
ncbi:TetR/AcrR family transcriptional regulator [Nocardia salmonicida]|uniref:TetR/AcrR family transcriptional regulator n=1 Tax=Nocardia salmonicida TaxID=53431 RepID=UPI00378B52B1